MGTIITNDNTGNIMNNTGMTQRAWAVVEIFKMIGQDPKSADMLVVGNNIEAALNSGAAASTVLAQACTSMKKPNLNQCEILGGLVGGDL